MNRLNVHEWNHNENSEGGYYELSMEFHPVGNDDRLNTALHALVKLGVLNGPINLDDKAHPFYGSIILSDKLTLPCMISVIKVERESDWLDLSIPQSILDKLYPYQYPLTNELNPWLSEVDEKLINIAQAVYAQSPFDLALLGEEISGETNHKEITLRDVERITCILPPTLQNSLRIQGNGMELSQKLRLFS